MHKTSYKFHFPELSVPWRGPTRFDTCLDKTYVKNLIKIPKRTNYRCFQVPLFPSTLWYYKTVLYSTGSSEKLNSPHREKQHLFKALTKIVLYFFRLHSRSQQRQWKRGTFYAILVIPISKGVVGSHRATIRLFCVQQSPDNFSFVAWQE